MIFQAQKFGFIEGWMAAVNAISLLEDSPFKSADRVSLPEDSKVKTQAKEQGKDSSNEEEGIETPKAKELSKQIDSHVVVLDDDNSRTTATISNPNAA